MINCTFESGNTGNLRHAVVDAIIIQDDKILLTRRAPNLRQGGQWAIPGGFVDRDETVTEAIMREVLEETGYTCEVKDLLTIVDTPARRGDDRQNISFVFTVSLIERVGKPDPVEVTEMAWFDVDQLPSETDMAFDHLEIIWEWIKGQS